MLNFMALHWPQGWEKDTTKIGRPKFATLGTWYQCSSKKQKEITWNMPKNPTALRPACFVVYLQICLRSIKSPWAGISKNRMPNARLLKRPLSFFWWYPAAGIKGQKIKTEKKLAQVFRLCKAWGGRLYWIQPCTELQGPPQGGSLFQ